MLSFGLIIFPEQGFRPMVKLSLKSGLLIQNLNFFDHQPKIVAKIHFQKGNLKFLFFLTKNLKVPYPLKLILDTVCQIRFVSDIWQV